MKVNHTNSNGAKVSDIKCIKVLNAIFWLYIYLSIKYIYLHVCIIYYGSAWLIIRSNYQHN